MNGPTVFHGTDGLWHVSVDSGEKWSDGTPKWVSAEKFCDRSNAERYALRMAAGRSGWMQPTTEREVALLTMDLPLRVGRPALEA